MRFRYLRLALAGEEPDRGVGGRGAGVGHGLSAAGQGGVGGRCDLGTGQRVGLHERPGVAQGRHDIPQVPVVDRVIAGVAHPLGGEVEIAGLAVNGNLPPEVIDPVVGPRLLHRRVLVEDLAVWTFGGTTTGGSWAFDW